MGYFGVVTPLSETRKQGRISQLETRLNSFYGPYYHLRRKSNLLYDKLKQPYAEIPNFSVLREILGGRVFTANDALLIEEIISIGDQCEELIRKNSGYIDDGNLRDDLLPRVSNHYRILKLAYEKKISPDIRFNDLTFPREIDQALQKAIKKIEDEKGTLDSTLRRSSE